MASVSYTSMVRKGRGGRNCKGGVVDAKIVKVEDKEGEWMGWRRRESGRKRHSWRLPHKLPKKASSSSIT